MNWNWKQNPLRWAPAQQCFLCEPCWNSQHIDPAFEAPDDNGIWRKYPKVYNCLLSKWTGMGGCGCGCRKPKQKQAKMDKTLQGGLFDVS